MSLDGVEPSPLNGQLYLLRMTTSVEQSVECLAAETLVLSENLPQCRYVHHKSHQTWHGLETGSLRWEVCD
jgi:hypothetical protein